jgi:hypothetical protein
VSSRDIAIRAVLIGVGGTVVLDLYAWLLHRIFGMPATNWGLVGRWIGLMPRGHFVQPQLGKADRVPGELAIGWVFHYLIGAGYGLLLVAIWGADWLQRPTVAAPMTLALALLVLPYFAMMPGMGMGMAASRAPKPNVARLKSVAGHSVFGIGMYLTALLATHTG